MKTLLIAVASAAALAATAAAAQDSPQADWYIRGDAGATFDSQIGGASGSGQIDQAKLRQLAQGWGQLPEVERTRVIQQLTRGMSSKHREAIINYFKNVANSQK